MKTDGLHFLDKLAGHLLESHSGNLQHVVVVLPNIRARLFLSNYFKARAEKALFLPEFMSSQDLMEKISGLRSADDFLILSKLYKAYPLEENEALSFEVFMNWGNTLLQDFKESDHQLVNAEKLFAQLSDIKQMEMWSVESGQISAFQEKYLSFCSKLGDLYANFSKSLEDDGLGHLGLIERRAAEKIDDKIFDKDQTIVIAGFNALTTAEESIFQFISKHFKTDTFFDYDHYYVDNDMHEAGHFARMNLGKSSKSLDWIANDFSSIKKDVSIYKCATGFEQSLVVSEILNKMEDEGDLLKTAVILPDESMLLPILQSLPDKVKAINITMGFPLIHSPYNSFFDTIIRLFINHRKKGHSDEGGFYHRDVLRLIKTEAIKQLSDESSKKRINQFLEDINKEKQVYVPYQQVTDLLTALFDFSSEAAAIDSSNEVMRLFKAAIYTLDALFSQQDMLLYKINREFLLHHMEVVVQVEKMLDQLNQEVDAVTLHKIWKHYTKLSKVQFTGEPLIGLQIMGLLESRNLDFDNVIILNVNEGMMPSDKKYGSLIPNDLKRQFGMQINKEKDAVFSYHFYRLLQRSKRVSLIYSSQIDEFGNGEKSRYIVQLQKELPLSNAEHTIKEVMASSKINIAPRPELPVIKSSLVMEVIKQKLQTGLSPTSISTYLMCPKDFYFSLLINQYDQEDIIENLEADIVGKAIHKTMELLYQPYKGKTLQVEDVREMEARYEDLLKRSFSEYIKTAFLMRGKNLLSFEMAKRMMARFLDKEVAYVKNNEIQIIDLEVKIASQIEMKIGDETLLCNVKGIVDRLEKRNGVYHLIDYKSGKTESKELKAGHLEEMLVGKYKGLQLMTYAWIFSRQEGYDGSGIAAGIYPFKSYKSTYLPLELSNNQLMGEQEMLAFEDVLKSIVGEMLNKDLPFIHNDDAIYCKYC